VAEGVTTVKVPEVLETTSGSNLVIRPYSVQLLPLLESGDIDYTFEYASVCAAARREVSRTSPQRSI
jgi:ABC-type molybdate transport system substrate-binding protein